MARVVQNVPDNTENTSSEAVRVENGDGDREILDVIVTTRLTGQNKLNEEQGMHCAWDGGVYFGATDSKPSENEFKDETNYLGRYQYCFHYDTRYDASNAENTAGSGNTEMSAMSLLPSEDVTKTWKEGVTMTFAISAAVTAAYDIGNDESIIVDFVVFYREK